MPKVSEKAKKPAKATAAKSAEKKKTAKKTAAEKAKLTKQRNAIKASMIEELKRRGADAALYLDQINKYMDLWDMYLLLAEDVKTKGLRYEAMTPSGQIIVKENPSVKNLPACNKQMIMQLKMMDLLNFSAAAVPTVDDEL